MEMYNVVAKRLFLLYFIPVSKLQSLHFSGNFENV